MRNRVQYILITATFSFFLASNVLGQRAQINYDDVFDLLLAKEYKMAEPYLRKYLSQNSQNANAYIYMGIIFQKKLTDTDDPVTLINYMDSAVYFFNKGISHLSVSHLKSNEKYYVAYSRRDLRTGKVGIKFEDILYDLNSRVNGLNNELLKSCRANIQDVALASSTKSSVSHSQLIKSKGKYFALVIGVSDYANYRLNLIRPALDAQKIADVITGQYNFDKENVSLLLNPTRQQILSELFSLRKKITLIDNLLIFYAGHGMYDEEAGQGYWWPRDADSDNPANWLSNSDLRDQIRGIKTSHTLLIADACFSGGIFRTRGPSTIESASLDIISLYKLPSRRAITSGTMTTVPDQSVFFDLLIKALKINPDMYLTSQGLFDSFRINVINNTLQVPQDGIISETGDEGGDFIFIKRN
ncbi:MAG: caspase family protein [Cyclobacteriaceae bacterium]